MSKMPIAFDTETHRFGLGNMAPKVVCLTWADGDGKSGIEVGHDNIKNWLETALKGAVAGRTLLIGANVAYDFGCILAHFPTVWDAVWRAYEADGVTCIQTRERLLDIATGEFNFPLIDGKKYKSKYSLADVAKVRLGLEIEKGEDTWRMRYNELDGIPLEQWPQPAIDYAVGDAITTFQCWENQESRSRQLRYSMPTEYHDVRAQLALHLMAVWGVSIDERRVIDTWNDYTGQMGDMSEDIEQSGLASPKKEDPEDVPNGCRPIPKLKQDLKKTREAIEKYYPGTPPRTNPTQKFPEGQIKTGEEVISECAFEPLQKIVRFNALQKICNTYLRKMFQPVVHARFWNVGTISDRTSCSGPNLQNLPRMPGVRECIQARGGHALIFTDYDSQEMRTLGQSCKDILRASKLADRYQADRHFDPHLEFAAQLAAIDVEEAKRLHEQKDPKIKKLRQQAKVANFGFPGGLGAKTLVSFAKGWGVEMDKARAYYLQGEWKKQWPEMNNYFAHVDQMVGEAGFGTQVNPRTGFRRGLVTYTEASNGYFQHLAAIASKQALWEITKRAYTDRNSALYGCRPVLFVHDEIGLEVSLEAVHVAGKEMEEAMIAAMEKWTPDVPCAASATAMLRWSKEAERVEKNGRLIPWQE
jgi:hypothetical protein